MTRLLLIRHGQTAAIGRYLSGTAPGTPLTESGRGQVRRLSERLRGVPIAAVVSSPMTRALETAAAIAEVQKVPVQTDAALTEFEVGGWTGRTFDDLQGQPEWHRFNGLRSLVRAPGGELMLDVQQRAVTALLGLAAQHPDATVAVVSHGDVIRAAVMFFLGMPLDLVHRIDISPARVSIVVMDGRAAPVVQLVNGDNVPEGS
jgi:probable phosphoglycerate mutase